MFRSAFPVVFRTPLFPPVLSRGFCAVVPRKRGRPAKGETVPKVEKVPAGPRGLEKVESLSSSLRAFMGKEQASRVEVIRAVWKHIKDKNLQKESDKRVILPDSTLKAIIPENEVPMMGMQKYIQKHIGEKRTEK